VRVIRIFLSSPSDVDLERAELAMLVRDINDTIQFLAPEREIRLELIHHETHAFPDVGSPQEVIDRQIPIDFDIYLGIMWKRCGTPTGGHPSGTIHEFTQALEHRERFGWPTIMFFFSDEVIEMPHDDKEVEQLTGVVRFRQQLASIGYTVTYPSRAGFREAVRGRLLRAFADVIERPQRQTVAEERTESVDPARRSELDRLTSEYDHVRATMPSGHDRTRVMTTIFHQLVALAPQARPLLDQLQRSSSAGERLAAIAILNAFPDRHELDWLAERLDNPDVEEPFVGYQAAAALGQAVRSLPADDLDVARTALDRALALARKLPRDSDRIRVLEYAQKDLDSRLSAPSSESDERLAG
jgi:hypothetical protein